MSDGGDPFGCITDHCITCSDEGLAMTVVALDDEPCLATCEDAGGTRSTIDIGLVDGVAPGTALLTHAGTAIAVIARSEPAS